MQILSIETSCDETAISILQNTKDSEIHLLGNALSSQIEIHAQYGGVFPALAKRAHAEKFTLLLTEALKQANLLIEKDSILDQYSLDKIEFLKEKESVLHDTLMTFFQNYEKPDIDYIAVTVGPGLEPALWVGVNAARALAVIWDIPVIPINHMEGHVVTATIKELPPKQDFSGPRVAQYHTELNQTHKDPDPNPLSKKYVFQSIQFPVLALLVSGGHTELVLSESAGIYRKIGQTRDDAVGEAFDKVARMIGLPYPGGPAVSRLAADFRAKNIENPFTLPRPMLHSQDYDFSFSGIKTAALYTIRDLGRTLTEDDKMAIASEFEDAVVEVLVKKTLNAVEEYNAQTVIVGGGVAGNTYLKKILTEEISINHPHVTLLFPEPWLATDNAVMIGLSAMTKVLSGQIKTSAPEILVADGNLSL